MILTRSLVAASFAASILLILGPLSVHSHTVPFGTINTELSVQGQTIDLYTALSQNVLIANYPKDRLHQLYEGELKRNFLIYQNDNACVFTLIWLDPSENVPKSAFKGQFSCPQPITSIAELKISSTVFAQEFSTYDHFVSLFLNNSRYELVFNRDHTGYPDTISASYGGNIFSYFMIVAAKFIWMGVIHIFDGFDHILFLLSIILLSRSVKQLLGVVTAFTVAHSITLILASFHVIEIPANFVEPAIAVTIAYMAYRNVRILWNDSSEADILTEGWVLAFVFGLIHGLGFASALTDSAIPHIFFISSLISFNIGIELAQLCILAIALPLLYLVDKSNYRNEFLFTISAAILALATAWFLVRMLLGEYCIVFVPQYIAPLLCI
jgi:hydrogenase/urease accessory protein HupE